jgi:hypothetical protein
MRWAFALMACLLLGGEGQALEFPGTCRGPTATVTDISGIDTPKARMMAKHSGADASATARMNLHLPGNEGPAPLPLAHVWKGLCAKGATLAGRRTPRQSGGKRITTYCRASHAAARCRWTSSPMRRTS